MSQNPPRLEIITEDLRLSAIGYIFDELGKIPKKGVVEDLPTFAERKRVLVAGSSARPGPYRFDNAPFWREPSYEISESTKTTQVSIMKATQTGGTEIILNHNLYCVEYGIGPICYVSSDEGLAHKHSETRFAPMIDAAGMQGEIVAPVKTKANKGTGDKINLKFFKGTFIQFIGARSESKASSTPIRVLLLDEVDKYPVQMSSTTGGNPITKLMRRTDSYGNLKKIIAVSTPKRKATSQIEPMFQAGDMRYYHISCPDCGELHRLEWKHIKWDKDENGKVLLEYDDDDNMINDPVWHECPHCGYKLRNHEKLKAMKEEGHGGRAKWIPTKKPDQPGLKSYHVNGLYGFRTFLEIVLEFQDSKDDPIMFEDWTTDTMGETWSVKTDAPEPHELQARAESDWTTEGRIPERVKLLTFGCDVQGDRIECAIMGWADNKEAWALRYHVIDGVTADLNDNCWNKLEEIITKEYIREDNYILKIQTALIDSPHAHTSVMNFCERFPWSERQPWIGVFPAIGKFNPSEIVKAHKSTIKTPEILIDDQKLKFEIYHNLRRRPPVSGSNYPYGYFHFPSEYGEEYYKQMTAEEIIETVDAKGRSTFSINNPKQRRNEVLDCTKMALAGLYFFYIMYFKTINERRKRKKLKEILPDWGIFWGLFGGGSEGKE